MRMRRITAILLMLLLMNKVSNARAFFGYDFSGQNQEDRSSAMQFRFEIENQYHVSVLMGEECLEVPTSGFELQIIPQGSSLFHWLYVGEDQYTEALKSLNSALSAYPEGFFRNFKSAAGDTRLQFLVGDRIIRNGQSYGAMTASDTAGHSSVFLAANATNPEASVHHALWHVIEARILFKAPMALKEWTNLNPEGFAYEEEESVLPGTDEDPAGWFVNEEAKQNEKEDRAAVFEAYMTKDDAWWDERPHLQAKLKFLLLRIQGVFKACP